MSGRGTRIDRRSLLRAAAVAGVAMTAVGTGGAAADEASVREQRTLAAAAGGSGTASATRVLWRARTTERVLALTFDDGPSAEYTLPLLDVLAQERVPATFCVVGRRLLAEPDVARRQVDAGHELVNHSWSHPDLSALPAAQVAAQLQRTDRLITALTGRAPALVRPPYGRLSGTVLAAAAALGHDVLLWDAQAVERHTTVEQNVRHLVGALRPGLVLLAHDQGPARRRIGMASVRPVIQAARERGYRFVTASEMVALDTAP